MLCVKVASSLAYARMLSHSGCNHLSFLLGFPVRHKGKARALPYPWRSVLGISLQTTLPLSCATNIRDPQAIRVGSIWRRFVFLR